MKDDLSLGSRALFNQPKGICKNFASVEKINNLYTSKENGHASQ